MPGGADIADLRERLRFSPSDGRIWLDDQRMVLIHVGALSAMRRELIDGLGLARARALLTRMGYQSGARDGLLARRVRRDRPELDAFMTGPQLHALEGMVAVDPVRVEADIAGGRYYGEFVWRDSSEAEAHLSVYGPSSAPVCWNQIGYASGYTSTFFGQPILYREIECRGMGHSQCRIIGRTAAEWGDTEDDIVTLRQAVSGGAPGVPAGQPPRRPEPGPGRSQAGIVGVSSGFNAALHLVDRVAATRATVLFLGETGVGKEVFARTLHARSDRAKKPFVAVNCAAIPEGLVEAELFGVERGAFTGAVQSRPGRFERADGGTLFLDEIGALDPAAQGKLLRALQEGEVERVGGTVTRRLDVRVVAATNADLAEAARNGRFRDDLFFRLNVFPIHLPALRERRDDIPLLIAHFLQAFGARYGRTVSGLTERAIDALLDYGYPGNIRELENLLERAVILVGDGEPIDIAHLFRGEALAADHPKHRLAPADTSSPTIPDRVLDDGLALEQLEASLIEAAVERAGGNLARAARSLGLTRPQLAYRYAKARKVGRDDTAQR